MTKKGVYFAFRDQGACLSLLAVKVYYLTCPEITVGFAHYPETATGTEVSSIEKVIGQCTDHSIAVSQPSYLCKGDGSWVYNTGQCACMAGYEAEEASQTCRACPVGRFKVRHCVFPLRFHMNIYVIIGKQCFANWGLFHNGTLSLSNCSTPLEVTHVKSVRHTAKLSLLDQLSADVMTEDIIVLHQTLELQHAHVLHQHQEMLHIDL